MIVGKIYFLLVRIKIKHMELAIIKRETTGSGPNMYHESENVTKSGHDPPLHLRDGNRSPCLPIGIILFNFVRPHIVHIHGSFYLCLLASPFRYEIMDGAPVKGESIPIRLFLAGFELAPTMRDVFKKFSVRYFLNLVLVDEEDRRYFKQQEIQIWRKGPTKKTMAGESVLFLFLCSFGLALGSFPSSCF